MPPALTILIPAAGLSSRMRGRDKLMEEVDGLPLLRRQVGMALNLDAKLCVTLPMGDKVRARSLADLTDPKLTVRNIPDAAEGMSASVRAGAGFCMETGGDGLMILLPDLPDLTLDDLSLMIRTFAKDPAHPLRATDCDGIQGHPVILPGHVLLQMTTLTGDAGARDILRKHPPRLCPLPGHHATRDLDTPEAWADWRAARQD